MDENLKKGNITLDLFTDVSKFPGNYEETGINIGSTEYSIERLFYNDQAKTQMVGFEKSNFVQTRMSKVEFEDFNVNSETKSKNDIFSIKSEKTSLVGVYLNKEKLGLIDLIQKKIFDSKGIEIGFFVRDPYYKKHLGSLIIKPPADKYTISFESKPVAEYNPETESVTILSQALSKNQKAIIFGLAIIELDVSENYYDNFQ